MRIIYYGAAALMAGMITMLLVVILRSITGLPEFDLSSNDSGIILEIIGFIAFLSVIRTKLAKNLGSIDPKLTAKDYGLIVPLFGIFTIIAGLILQMSFFN